MRTYVAALVLCVLGIALGVEGVNFSFPSGSPWYTDISSSATALDPDSDNVINYLSGQGIWSGGKFQLDFSFNIQYVSKDTQWYTYVKGYSDPDDYTTPDCDDLSTFPVTPNGLIEGENPYNEDCDDDCHYIVVDNANNVLYENYNTYVDTTKKQIRGNCAIKWNLCALYPANLRGDQCTSTDAAGFPIAPLLTTADELAAGEVNHAMRFILPNNVMRKNYYVHPASHSGGPTSTNAHAINYGSHLRLKQSFNPSSLTNQPPSKGTLALIAALKKYGMFLSDGGNIPLTLADDKFTDAKYDDPDVLPEGSHSLYGIQVTDFEVLAHDTPIQTTYDCVLNNLIAPSTCGTPTVAPTPAPTPTTTSHAPTNPPTPSPTSSNATSTTGNSNINAATSATATISMLLMSLVALFTIV